MTRRTAPLALTALLSLGLAACGPDGPAYTFFEIHNDSSQAVELAWFDADHRPVVIAEDGERFQVSGGNCTKRCDDLSPGVMMCDAMAPLAEIPAGLSMDLGWNGERLVPGHNLFAEACLHHDPIAVGTYTVHLCVRPYSEAGDAAFVCKDQDFELEHGDDWQAAPRVPVHFADADLP